MTWEWEHRSNGGQWVVTLGAWHAVVQRVAGARLRWQATIGQTTASHDQYASPTYPEAVDARTGKEDHRIRWRGVMTRSSGHHR
jgi:hypothetical protein